MERRAAGAIEVEEKQERTLAYSFECSVYGCEFNLCFHRVMVRFGKLICSGPQATDHFYVHS